MDRIKHTILILILSFSLLYPAGRKVESSRLPVWIDNPTERYSEDRYLVGLGTGDNREAAADKAFARLSQLFGVEVKADNRSEERYISSIGASTSIKNDVALASKHTLINAKISETYFDRGSGTFYALATLEKLPTSRLVANEIEKNNKVINEYISQADTEKDAIYKYSLYDLSYIIAERNEIFASQMPLLSGFNANVSHPTSSTLRNKANETRRKISFYVETDDKTGAIKKTIENVFTSMSYSLADKSKASYIVTENTTYDINDTGYGIFVVNYTTSIVLNNSYGENLTSFSFTGKQGGKDTAEAMRNVRLKLSNDIPKSLSDEFNKYFDSVIKLK